MLSSSGWPWKRMAGCAERAPIVRRDALVDVENAVDRRLEGAGEFRHHHVGEAPVAAEDRRRAQFLAHAHDVAEFDHGLVAGHAVGGHRRRGQQLAPGQIAFRQPHHDLDRIAAFAAMRIADRGAAEQRLRSCRRRRAARRRRIPDGPDRSRCAGAAAARRSNRRCRRCRAPTRRSSSVRRPRRAGWSSSGRRLRRAASPAPAARAALRPRGRPCRPAGSLVFSRARRSSAMAWLRALALAARRQIEIEFAQFGQFARYNNAAPAR